MIEQDYEDCDDWLELDIEDFLSFHTGNDYSQMQAEELASQLTPRRSPRANNTNNNTC